MNKILKKVMATACLIIGVAFGALSIYIAPSSPLVNSAYADELDADLVDDIYANPDTNTPNDTSPNNPNADVDADLNDELSPGNDNNSSTDSGSDEAAPNVCLEQSGALGWIVCPTGSLVASITDALYAAIGDMLTVSPISMANDSPVYIVWQYMRNITNILFIIFLLIVIYSQLTGLGLSNYGLKRVLPRLIITVIMINLSFVICAVIIDVSNIVGANLRGFFENIQDTVINNGSVGNALANFSLSDLLATVLAGGTIAGITISAVGGAGYIFYMLFVILLGAIVSVVTGLITISARQAVVALLVMIAPLAFLAYLLPNTEKYFTQWKNLFFRMLVFYPMFSFLFGASQLIGYTLIASANSAFGLILGVAVQFFPLFASWPLMRMSGTMLASLNTGLRSLISPAQRAATGWGLSVADQKRQDHLANSSMAGAKLRRYLDQRRERRALDTHNSIDIRRGKAIEGALTDVSSSAGYDKEGNLAWKRRANRYTLNAKRASLYNTRASNAQTLYQSTISGAGDIFTNDSAIGSLANDQAQEFVTSVAYQHLAVNNAQADQDWLLQQYTQAINKRASNPYQYNRLVKSAAGGIRHLGEASIMGQVIVGNSKIERRRRDEARIMITKYGVDKASFRGMSFDINNIHDDGFEYDENGKCIEDDMYNIKDGYRHTPWQQYIAVHLDTGNEITKDQYDALSDDEKADYKKVRYMHIKDDNENVVQTVYDDDAGYMKELLTDDIMIGDPVVDRYGISLGVGRHDGEQTGVLRRYQSTITNALNASSYKDHDTAYTSMLAAHLSRGFITSPGQRNIAKIASYNASARPNAGLINDPHVIKMWQKWFEAISNPELAMHYFPDLDLENYDNVNDEKLAGLQLGLDENGNPLWIDVTNSNPNITNEDRRNKIIHGMLLKSATKWISTLDRQLSPNVLEKQKPDTLAALIGLFETLDKIGKDNLDPTVPFEQKLDGKTNIFAGANPRVLQDKVAHAKEYHKKLKEGVESGLFVLPTDDEDTGHDNDGPGDFGSGPDGGAPTGSGPSRGNNLSEGTSGNSSQSNNDKPTSNNTVAGSTPQHSDNTSTDNTSRLENQVNTLKRHQQYLNNKHRLNDPEQAAEYIRTVNTTVKDPQSRIDLLQSYLSEVNDEAIQKAVQRQIEYNQMRLTPHDAAVLNYEINNIQDQFAYQPPASTEQAIHDITHGTQNADAREEASQNAIDNIFNGDSTPLNPNPPRGPFDF